MANPRSRITAVMSTNWPQMLMRLNVIGVRRLGERITMASVLFSFMTSPLSQSRVFTSCMQAPRCRRHTGGVACCAGVIVSLKELCRH